MLLRLGTDSQAGTALLRLSGFWITDERVGPEIVGELGVYWGHNVGTADPPVLWDSYKAYTQGQYQRVIGKVRKERQLALEGAELRARELESDNVHRAAEIYNALQAVHREISLLRTTATRKILLGQTHRIFKQGDRTSRMLVWLVRERSFTPHIANIRD